MMPSHSSAAQHRHSRKSLKGDPPATEEDEQDGFEASAVCEICGSHQAQTIMVKCINFGVE
jgi:hypothetical protein